MNNIAVLLTCFNRKEKTLKSLECLQNAKSNFKGSLEISVYLTDDGSTDNTADAVAKNFSEVIILKGSGELFWAEGMRNSWKKALKHRYDGFLLINDDTELYDHIFQEIFLVHKHCLDTYKMAGIYIGTTEDKVSKQLTYGGSIITNKFLYISKLIKPDNTIQKVDLGNANIMMVPKEVVDKIGIFTEGYAHGHADYDYTLMAKKHDMPCLIMNTICGHCPNDHPEQYHNFKNLSLAERKKKLLNPIGLDFKSHLKFNTRFFPYRVPFLWSIAWLKMYFPKIYLRFLKR